MYCNATLIHFPIAHFFNLSLSPSSRSFKSSPSLCSPKIRAFRGLSMEDQNRNDAFYLVRKGEMVGIYKSLADCRAQTGSSASDPSISVFKGYGMSNEAEEFLRSHGLKNASYSVTVDDATHDVFGKFGALIPCTFQQPDSLGAGSDDDENSERWEEATKLIELAERGSLQKTPQKKKMKPDSSTTSLGNLTDFSNNETAVDSSVSMIPQTNLFNLDNPINSFGGPTVSSGCDTCIIEFDGASKGNPGVAGAGALLRSADGSSVWQLREGVGLATNNVAEYRALLLGLKRALMKGFKHVVAKGDSKLVVMQVQGKWKTKNPNMAELCNEAKKLVTKFVSFKIDHVLREYNSAADDQANQAIYLKDGQVQEDHQKL